MRNEWNSEDGEMADPLANPEVEAETDERADEDELAEGVSDVTDKDEDY